jgi:LytS/YehU family sensor histidine kinase
MVAPMLFLPFIENAFKHAEKKAGDAIRIHFGLGRDRIVFDCENSFSRMGADTTGGLGNSLIRKRLDLLYPGKHELQISAGEDRYRATLILDNHAN